MSANNSSVNSLLNRNPDFVQNLYSIKFCKHIENPSADSFNRDISNFEKGTTEIEGTTDYKDIVLKSVNEKDKFYLDNLFSSFNVRISGINIPQPISETYKMNIAGRSVTKIKPRLDFEHKVSITYNVDYDMNLYMYIQNILGVGSNSKINETTITTDDEEEKTTTTSSLKEYELKELDIKNAFDIKIDYIDNDIYTLTTKSSSDINYSYTFTNCKVIGQSKLAFDKEDANLCTATFDFIFEDLKLSYN